MGVRSDVAVCLTSELFTALPEETHKWMKGDADQFLEAPEGVMFLFRDTKWYYQEDEAIRGLYKWLHDQDEDEDYLIVTACSEYPEADDDENIGTWYSNPWNVCRNVTVELSYDSP